VSPLARAHRASGGVITVLTCAAVAVAAPTAADARPARAYCRGDYAEDLAALSPHARDVEAGARSYSFAVRTTATYECIAYGADGNLKRTRETATAHGTAFGYRRDGDGTLLVTNQHVAEWPAVTAIDHPVDNIPAGCKRVADTLKIVDNDQDRFADDDIPLSRVVVDPALDVAILRAAVPLPVIPWQIGTSAALAARAVVEVKGFPLGAFQATNLGKVISAHDHDEQGERDHDDFVIDALLSSGGSGSPVLAVSCKTGAFELVGIFHAHYNEGSALNLVIAIDQVRELMTTLARAPHPRSEPGGVVDAAARARLVAAAQGDDPPFFSFGSLVASVHARPDGALVFTVFGADFPRTTRPVLVLEDLPEAAAFGKPGGLYLGSARGLRPCAAAGIDAETRELLRRTLDVLRRDALAAFDYRAATATAPGTHAAFESADRSQRALLRMLDTQRDVSQRVLELTERIAPQLTAPTVSVARIQAGPARYTGTP